MSDRDNGMKAPNVDIGAVMDALPAQICILDRQATIVATNRAWREFAGGATMPQRQQTRSKARTTWPFAIAPAARMPNTAGAPPREYAPCSMALNVIFVSSIRAIPRKVTSDGFGWQSRRCTTRPGWWSCTLT